MATMYVYNIPTDNTVNLRKTASSTATVLVRVGYGKAVQASYYNSTWHSASYKGYSGYIMSKYLTTTDPNGGSGNTGTGTGTGTPTAGVIKGTSVRVRKEPNTTSAILAHVNTGDKVTYYAGESYSGNGYSWYRCTSSKWSNNGYIATNYVKEDTGTSDGGTGGNTDKNYTIRLTVETDRFGTGTSVTFREKASTTSKELGKINCGTSVMVSTVDGEWLPTTYNGKTGFVMAKYLSGSTEYTKWVAGVTKTVSYNRNAAVAYALKYSSNDTDTGTDSYNNAEYKPVGNSTEDINKDCANFVSQCLFAGGMPMHDGWYYRYPGNVTNPSVNAAWKGTNSQKKAIAARKFGERVYDISKLKKGDIVYTYDTKKNNGTFGHVVILSEDVGSSSNMIVCGHTLNQRNATRTKKDKDAYFHIYDSLPIKDTDYFG